MVWSPCFRWEHSLREVKELALISENESCSVVSDSLRPHGLYPTRLLCPWNSPGQSTGVGSHSLLQGILPTQGLNPGLLHCGWILYCLSHQGSPKSWSFVNSVATRLQSYYTAGSPRAPVPVPVRLPWNSPGQNTGVGSLSLLQGIFPT